ncbi:rhodanese-related sulfurtransferase [bacterium]|nr:rhodanese-related sulfurtransferase [bacterium]
MIKKLYNKKSKDILIENLEAETFNRITCSFYNYIKINSPFDFRNKLYSLFHTLNIFGRIYVADEGINAQISVPSHNWAKFLKTISEISELSDVQIKKAISEGISFYKLVVKVKKEIVAYRIPKNKYNMKIIGKHLSTEQFNSAINKEQTTIIDMRNIYESEVGKFKNAEIPQVEKSKDLLPEVRRMLKGREHHQVLLYCTGGIRCEKASSFLINEGIENVKQLKGGIIQYAHDIKKNGVKSKFIGKNFVFDARLGERVSDDIISNCHICNKSSDIHRDCKNDACHILFIQCQECERDLNGCCSDKCKEIASLPIETQKDLRKNRNSPDKRRYFKSPQL